MFPDASIATSADYVSLDWDPALDTLAQGFLDAEDNKEGALLYPVLDLRDRLYAL